MGLNYVTAETEEEALFSHIASSANEEIYAHAEYHDEVQDKGDQLADVHVLHTFFRPFLYIAE